MGCSFRDADLPHALLWGALKGVSLVSGGALMFHWGLCLESITIPCAIVLPFPNGKGACYSPPLRKGKLRHRGVVASAHP